LHWARCTYSECLQVAICYSTCYTYAVPQGSNLKDKAILEAAEVMKTFIIFVVLLTTLLHVQASRNDTKYGGRVNKPLSARNDTKYGGRVNKPLSARNDTKYGGRVNKPLLFMNDPDIPASHDCTNFNPELPCYSDIPKPDKPFALEITATPDGPFRIDFLLSLKRLQNIAYAVYVFIDSKPQKVVGYTTVNGTLKQYGNGHAYRPGTSPFTKGQEFHLRIERRFTGVEITARDHQMRVLKSDIELNQFNTQYVGISGGLHVREVRFRDIA